MGRSKNTFSPCFEAHKTTKLKKREGVKRRASEEGHRGKTSSVDKKKERGFFDLKVKEKNFKVRTWLEEIFVSLLSR